MSSDYYGAIAGEIADRNREDDMGKHDDDEAPITDALAALPEDDAPIQLAQPAGAVMWSRTGRGLADRCECLAGCEPIFGDRARLEEEATDHVRRYGHAVTLVYETRETFFPVNLGR